MPEALPAPYSTTDIRTTPENYDPKVLARAYELYLKSNNDLTDIAIELKLDREVLTTWASRGKWRTRKKEMERELMILSEAKFRDWILNNKLETAKRLLATAKEIETAVQEEIKKAREGKEALSADRLKKYAEALSHAASVSAKMTGLSEASVAETATGRVAGSRSIDVDEDGEKVGKMFVFNVQPVLPAGAETRVREARPIKTLEAVVLEKREDDSGSAERWGSGGGAEVMEGGSGSKNLEPKIPEPVKPEIR